MMQKYCGVKSYDYMLIRRAWAFVFRKIFGTIEHVSCIHGYLFTRGDIVCQKAKIWREPRSH